MAEPVAHDEQESTSHPGLARYLWVWVALLVFTVLTYSVSRVHLPGPWHVTAALLIALTKGALVVLFFMHLWDQRGANRLVFATSLVFVTLLISLVLADNATRFSLANPPGTAGALPAGGADREPPPATAQGPEP